MGTTDRLVDYETLDDGRIARIWLNRPETHNAQNRTLLVQLDEAFGRAEADDTVRVVILAARGKNFSAGHDLGSEAALAERSPGPAQHPTFQSHGATREPVVEKMYLQEWHFFFQNTCRWRDLRKITIAQVQGNAISAGLMLIWACDLIVAADNARFSDVVGVRLGMPGVEYYAHPWEFGPRKAKELLLTGDSLDADEAHRLGLKVLKHCCGNTWPVIEDLADLYDGYEAMAVKIMAELGVEIAAAHELTGIAMVHRLGRIEIGEAAVVIAVSAPHRHAAFDAAREGIDRLKKRVPVWKKEHFADGEVWVEGEWETPRKSAG